MQTPEFLLSATWLLPIAPNNIALTDHGVAVRDGRITAVAPISDLIQQFPDCAHTHLQDQILLPGLVNAHGHAAMSLMRGVGAGLALQEWLQEAIWPFEAKYMDAQAVALGTELALAEMLLSGTTTLADMYFFPETVARVAHQTGMRCQITAPIINFATSWSRDADDALHKTMALYDEYRHHPLIRVAFGPHSAYSLERKHLNQIAMYADELEAAVQIHLHETHHEVAQAHEQLGHGHVELLRDTGLLGPRLQTVHMTQLTAAEIDMVAAAKASVVVAAAHGIPASYTQGLRKLERDDYFRAVDAALRSSAVDVLVTHANAKLPGLHDDVLRDEDAPRLYDAFLRSSASLHVHGHMHTEPAVAVVAPGKVVVNADCRVVVFAAAAES